MRSIEGSISVHCLFSPLPLIEEPEEPEGNLLSPSSFHVGACVDDVGVLSSWLLGADAVAEAVDSEGAEAVAHAHVMAGPEGVLEEGLVEVDGLHAVGVDGVHEVGVVHHDACGLLGEVLVGVVDHVDESRVGEVLDVVHDGGARGLDVGGELADVGRGGAVYGEHVEELLELGEVLELDLLDEQDVDLNHHVHGLEEVLAEVAALEEEGVEAVVEVGLEEALEGVDDVEHLGGDALVAGDDLLEGAGREVAAGLEVEELAEGESAQVVAVDEAVELGVLVLEAHDAGAGEDDAQAGVLVVAAPQLGAPGGVLEHLVDEEHLAAHEAELAREVGEALALEVEVVHVDVEAAAAAHVEVLAGVLEQEAGLADAAGALDADEGASPVDLVHEGSSHGEVGVLDEVGVGAKEGLHVGEGVEG